MAIDSLAQFKPADSTTMPFKIPLSTTPSIPYVRDCMRCAHPEAPIVCKRCQCVAYCSADHQKADTQRHRKQCKPVADTRKAMDQEEQALLKEDPYAFDDPDGSFYLIYETRPYVRAKYAYIKALAEVGTFLATEMALKEAKESLFLNEQDNLAVRDGVPVLLLSLGRLQEAYDFIRFWATFDDSEGGDGEENEDENEDEDEDMEDGATEPQEQPVRGKKGKALLTRKPITGVAPCFKPSGADMLEPLDVFIKPRIESLFHLCALTYIKTVIFHALTGAIRKLEGEDEAEKADVMAFLASNKLPSDLEALQQLQAKIHEQAVRAEALVDKKYPRFWGPLTNPTGRTIMSIDAPVYGLDSETQEWLIPYSDLWRAEGYKLHFLVATSIPEHVDIYFSDDD